MKRASLSTPRRMILTELFSDLGEQFIHLTVLAELFFGLAASQANLLLICLIQQAPAILLGPVAGRWVDLIGPRNGIVGGNLVRLLLAVGLLLARGQWAVWPIYLLFAIASLVFVISRLCITPRIVAPKELIGYNALNEWVALAACIGGPFLIGRAGASVTLAMGMGMYGCSAWLALGLPKIKNYRCRPCRCWLAIHGGSALLFKHDSTTPPNQDIHPTPAVRAALHDPGHRRHQCRVDVDQLQLLSQNR